MRLKILFTILIILTVGILVYQKAPEAGLKNFFENQQEELKVENEGAQNEGAASEENLTSKELPSLPKVPEIKPVESKKEVSTPGPLMSPTPAPAASPSTAPTGELASPSPPPSASLTSPGIILEANIQRQQNGLGLLSTDSTLNATALSKASDMCDSQYFAHVSPSGVGVGDLADSFGYDYIAIGENLAYGPFASNAAVVEAWMASPGHRANILNSKFTEMGAAAVRCTFQGKNTWLAVQHFGKPVSDCPRPDAALLQTINGKKDAIAYLKLRITNLKGEIETTHPLDSTYSDKVNSYNSLVGEYNNLIRETKTLISDYNNQVSTFNVCAAS